MTSEYLRRPSGPIRTDNDLGHECQPDETRSLEIEPNRHLASFVFEAEKAPAQGTL